jgi:pyruvate kinase
LTTPVPAAGRLIRNLDEAAAVEGLAGPGEIIAIAAGMPFGVNGTTNLLRIERLSTSQA